METTHHDGAGEAPTPSEAERLATMPWPPPGLDRIIGDVYVAVRWLSAGAFLILPLLWSIVAEQDPWAIGPLGSTLWIAFLLAILGVPIVLAGYLVLARLIRRTVAALEQGYQARVVALVVTDNRRDTGFLVQGAREYRVLEESTRRRLGSNRIVVGLLLLFAALWVSLGFGASVVLAARGVLGPLGVVLLTAAPSFVAALIATLAYLWEERILRRCRRRWHSQTRSMDLVREEIRAWQAGMAKRAPGVLGPEDVPETGGRFRQALRGSYVVVGAATLVAFVPVFTLILSAAIIPVLAGISVPEVERAVGGFAAVEPLRSYTLEPDTAIGPAEAGAILHTLTFVGRPYEATEGVLPPARVYEEAWFPPGDVASPPLSEWAGTVADSMGRPLPPDRLDYLEQVAAHPAHAELARLARAGALDISAVRWSLPLPSDITLDELAMPMTGSLRDAAYAHLARAAVQAAEGNAAAADTTIREVLSVGLLMVDESPSILDNLVGLALVELAGEALVSLYRNTGHPDADALPWALAAAERSAARARRPAVEDVAARLRAMPQSALDTMLVRGVRWEYVGLLTTVAPCINLRRVVFGPDADYRSWLERVESRLVRYPAEAELFGVARGGLLGRDPGEATPFSTRLLALTMGDADRPGSCAQVLGETVGF